MIFFGYLIVYICICGDGRVFLIFIIFEKSLFYIVYKDGVFSNWLFGYFDSGYMDSELFLFWFKMVFFLNCGVKRLVFLIMDNYDFYIILDLIECVWEN